MIEYSHLQKALKRLELQYENYKTLDQDQPEWIKEAVAESVIRRFETCSQNVWNVLKRYLIEALGIPEVANSPKTLIRRAGENELLPSSTEQWLDYADARIGTSHEDSGEKAIHALELMGAFIDDAIGLYQTMSGETWQ